MKPYKLVFITDDEDREAALDKVCKEKNISGDTHEFMFIHFISTKYADEQKQLGNWPLS
jgi:3,4-dihydroxy-2-butanone 4-phosphate synthase